MAEPSVKPREFEQEQEIIPALRQEDAEWKVIQQNTFTRWVNNHLKKADDTIHNLETDFADGLKLINLAMVLSQKNLGRFNKKVNFRSQKLENVSLALNFFQDVEGIKIINIDSSHIVDQNKKLILGLIWTLILHYSISMGWIVEKREGQPDETPKQKLLNWIRGSLPGGMPLTNFTSDWNDGIALGALVNAIAPGSVPEWSNWHPANALPNTEEAMQSAQEYLGVAPLITAAELIHPEIDEMSVMTYLSQFPISKPIKAAGKPLPAAPEVPVISGHLEGIDVNPIVNKPTQFEVAVQGEGFKPKVHIHDPDRKDVHHTITKVNPNHFTVKYTPLKIGNHELSLELTDVISGESIVIPEATTSIQVVPSARLCPYNDRPRIGEEVSLRIEDAFNGPVEVVVVDASDKEYKLAVIEASTPGVHTCEYIPVEAGLHSLNVFHRRSHIEDSPFPLRAVNRTPALLLWGRGLASDGIRIGDTVPVHLRTKSDQDELDPSLIQLQVVKKDSGEVLPVFARNDCAVNTATLEYTPKDEGEYVLTAGYGGSPLDPSNYEISVLPPTTSAICAFGPGLQGGVAKEQSVFEVVTNGETDRLAFSIEGPSKSEIQCQDRGNGAALVAYTPTEPGVYKINVLAGGEHIHSSPFVVMVDKADETFQPGAARLTGLDPSSSHTSRQPIKFQIDTRRTQSTVAPHVKILDSKLACLPLSMREMSPCLYEVEFTPEKCGRYHVDSSLRGVAIPGAPFTVNVREPVDLSKLRMYGPGIDGPVLSREPTYFTIDAKQAGPGAVEVSLADREGQSVDIDVLDNEDGSFTVKYTAPRPGAYQLNVVFAGEEIPPIEINVKPHVDVAGIRVEGLENGVVLVGHKTNVLVNTGSSISLGRGLEVIAEINGTEYLLPLSTDDAGNYSGHYVATDTGKVFFKVLYDDLPVKEATWTVNGGHDAGKCRALGDGLSMGIVGEPAKFTIDTQGGGEGSLSLDLAGPAESPSHITDNEDGTCAVQFVPKAPGKYTIGIKFGDGTSKEHIHGSPFVCVVDYPFVPSSVKVEGLDDISPKVGTAIDFAVDASSTKLAPVTCRVPPVYQQPLVEYDSARRVYHCRFTPVGEAGDVVPVEICYDGVPVSGSPFMLTLSPAPGPQNVKIALPNDGASEAIPASLYCSQIVDARDCGEVKSIKAEVKGPDGHLRKCVLSPTDNDKVFELRWLPDIVGEYASVVSINGQPSQACTVEAVKCGDSEDIKLGDDLRTYGSSIAVEEPSVMSFRRPVKAGEHAQLCVVQKVPDAANIVVKSDVRDGIMTDVVSITPIIAGPNSLYFYYGGEKIHQVDYEAVPSSQLNKEEIIDEQEKKYYNNNNNNSPSDPTLFTREFKFNFDCKALNFKRISAVVTMPSKQTDHAEIIDNHDGSILIKYNPKVHGQHELSIFQDGVQVQGTPVKFFVDSYGDGYATVYGPGLQAATVGEPAAFTVCAKGSHAKELSVSIEGPAQSTIKIHDNKDGTCSVTWVPPVPGEYKVHVLLGKKEVRDSPFSVLVAGEGQKRSHLSVGSTSEVALNITQTELKGISASIKSPSGIEEPCFVRLIEGGRLGVSFTPREAGEHLITVKRDGKLLPKAPFKIKVDKSQVGDASKVEVSGDGKSKAVCQETNEILVDTTKAGFGGLSVSVQGPSKAELLCKEVKAGLIKVSYRPTEPGIYVIAIKFADHHVRDSPLTVNCTGKGLGRVQNEITKVADQANINLPNQDANMFLKLPNTSPMDVSARIMDPKGQTEDVEMRDTGDQYYLIKFRPKIDGVHALSVMHKDSHVNGSPFQFTVGTFGEGGAHKVRASGNGVIRGETTLQQSFNLYTREAGPGKLSVAMEGPSKATLEFKDHKDGNCHVDYKVITPGEYIVSVKFNDQHIPDSPFKVFIAAHTGEARKLELAQFHDNIPAGKAFTFTVLTHRARGHLEGKVMTPSNITETIDIVPIEDGESYALRFIPKETGNHYVHVTLDGAPMRDSPFRLRVGGSDLSDPTAIAASGEGLVKGITGQKSEFIIKTTNAGSGALSVQVDGPSKVTLDAYEMDLGYKVRFTPLAPGDYFAAVKYNGIHIPGSPFKIPVEGKVLGGNGYNESSMVKIDAVSKTSKGTVATVPEYKGDASKVVAKGAGLNKFFPGRPSVFTIDTGLAGSNLLMVGVVTTKGPCEEVIVKHQGGGHYIVNYKIPDRVKGFVFIKYGDQEIPGSPFSIEP